MTIRKIPLEGENMPTVCGEQFKKEYEMRYDESLVPYLEQVGCTDLQAYIDSHEESVNVNNIMERYSMGDENAIEKVNGFYADVSELPLKLQDVLNLNIKAKKDFSELPDEVRRLYNDNYIELVNDPGRINQLFPQDEKVPEEKAPAVVPESGAEVIADGKQE